MATTKAMLEEMMGMMRSFDERLTKLESAKAPTSSLKEKKTTKGKGNAEKLHSIVLKDYEPKKVNGFYIWGKKTDTVRSGHYMAMQKAYCYAVATKGEAISSDEAYKKKITVDFSENGAYYKAKAQFNKKFPYIKKADR